MRTPFSPPPGINADDTDFSKVGWSSASWVRFVNGKEQTRRGWEKYVSTALSGVCRNVHAWTDNTGELNTAYGTHTHLQVYVGGMLYDITPSGLAAGNIDGTGGAGYGTGAYDVGDYGEPSTADYFPRTWSLANWGQNLIACPRGGQPAIWENNTSSDATVISNAPEHVTYLLVSPLQRQVIALGADEEVSEDFNPMCIRTSNLQDYTDWTTSTGNLAREYILSGSGRIVSGRFIGEYLAVWTNGGLYLGTYIGDPTQVWRFDPVAQNCGLIGPNAVVVRGQTAFWITPSGQFMSYTLGGAPLSIPSGVRNYLFDNLAAAQQDKIVATTISAYDEVEWFYPDARDGNENSRSVSVNVAGEYPVWMTHQVARTAFLDADPADYPIGVTYGGDIFWHEKGFTADGGALSGFLESGDQYLNSAQDRLLVRGMVPDFQDQQGAINLSIITRDEAQGPETTRGPYALAPSTQRKDFFVEARLARVRYDFNSAPAYWRGGKPTFDVVKTGQW